MRQPWWIRPRYVLPLIGALIVAVALVTPTPAGTREGDPRVSTLNPAPLGGQLVFELAHRLGWDVERQTTARLRTDKDVIHAVLSPVVPLRATETHALLEQVRAGGALLVSTGTGGILDSLKLRQHGSGVLLGSEVGEVGGPSCRDEQPAFARLWFGDEALMLGLAHTGPVAGPVDTLLRVRLTFTGADNSSRVAPAMVAFPLGAGRVVVASDPDIFRNDAVRDCHLPLGIAVVRALEYLRDGGEAPRTRVIFDEYHQGHGAHPGSLRAIALYLGFSPSGRLLLQLAIAATLLLLAAAPRAVAPRDPERIERRSPLEHVDALSRAYAQVGATRTASRRLVRGFRRRLERVPRGAVRVTDDAAFLDRLAALHPALAEDVSLLKRALTTPLSVTQFAALAPVIHRLESTLTQR